MYGNLTVPRWHRMIWVLLLIIAQAGCDLIEPDDDDSDRAPSYSMTDYAPMAGGYEWIYRRTQHGESNGPDWKHVITGADTLGADSIRFQFQRYIWDEFDGYWADTEQGFERFFDDGWLLEDLPGKPDRRLKDRISPSQHRVGDTLDVQGFSNAWGGPQVLTVYALNQTITTPAGRFDGCYTVKDANVRPHGWEVFDLRSFAPGVGYVRTVEMEIVDADDDGDLDTLQWETEELIDVQLGGD